MHRAGATFPIVIDVDNRLGALYGYRKIPNGILLDDAQIIRYRKDGGFSVDRSEDVDAVERLIRGEVAPSGGHLAIPYTLAPAEQEEVETRFRLATALLRQGDAMAAVREWRQALHLDPENLLIRKQIWQVEHPERFQPTIDWAWQRLQLERERAAEVAAGICSPDGCPLPVTRTE